jgi:Tfp pilus assembly protein PilF
LAYLGKGDTEKGRADLQRALQLRPDYAEAKAALVKAG